MDALKVCIPRIIAGFHQGVIACLHERAHAAAKHSLLAEQVGLGFRAECGLQNAGACAADAQGIGQADIQCVTGGILLNSNQAGNALAGLILAADGVAGAFGSDHNHVDELRGLDAAEVNIEAVCKSKRLALGQVGLNAFLVQLGLLFIVDQNHDHVAGLGSIGGRHDFQSCSFGLCPALGAVVQTDNHIHTGIAQIQRMGMALGAVSDNRNRFAFQFGQITVLLIIDLLHVLSLLLFVRQAGAWSCLACAG